MAAAELLADCVARQPASEGRQLSHERGVEWKNGDEVLSTSMVRTRETVLQLRIEMRVGRFIQQCSRRRSKPARPPMQVVDTTFEGNAVLALVANGGGGGGAVSIYGRSTPRMAASFVRVTWRNSSVYGSAPSPSLPPPFRTAQGSGGGGGSSSGGGAVNVTTLALLTLEDCVFEGSRAAMGHGGALMVSRVSEAE